jgi:hypothetical protein
MQKRAPASACVPHWAQYWVAMSDLLSAKYCLNECNYWTLAFFSFFSGRGVSRNAPATRLKFKIRQTPITYPTIFICFSTRAGFPTVPYGGSVMTPTTASGGLVITNEQGF